MHCSSNRFSTLGHTLLRVTNTISIIKVICMQHLERVFVTLNSALRTITLINMNISPTWEYT